MVFTIKKILCTSATLGLLTLTNISFANNFNYNYASVFHAKADDLKGTGGSVVYSINSDTFITGDYTKLDIDSEIEDVKVTGDGFGASLSIGKHMPIQDKMDGFLSVGYAKVENDVKGGGRKVKVDESGLLIKAGIRYKVTDEFDAEATVAHVKIKDVGTTVSGGGVYHLNEQFSVGATLSNDDESTKSFFARINF